MGQVEPAGGPLYKAATDAKVVDTFDDCDGTNRLGGASGAAYVAPDILKESYVAESIVAVWPGLITKSAGGALTGCS